MQPITNHPPLQMESLDNGQEAHVVPPSPLRTSTTTPRASRDGRRRWPHHWPGKLVDLLLSMQHTSMHMHCTYIRSCIYVFRPTDAHHTTYRLGRRATHAAFAGKFCQASLIIHVPLYQYPLVFAAIFEFANTQAQALGKGFRVLALVGAAFTLAIYSI